MSSSTPSRASGSTRVPSACWTRSCANCPATCFTDLERLVLSYTDALVYDLGRVSDGLFDALRAQLSDEEILELTYISTLYLHHAVMSKALRTEFDDRPDAMTEVFVDGADTTLVVVERSER